MPAAHTFMDYVNITIPGWVVPQTVYETSAVYDRRPTIRFYENGQPGLRLQNAFTQNFSGLHDANTPVDLSGGMKIAVRIQWPGYEPWAKHMHVCNHASDKSPITKARLAYDLARIVKQFIQDMSINPSQEPRPDWWLTNIRFENLVLLELRHVSGGSWQPVLCRTP